MYHSSESLPADMPFPGVSRFRFEGDHKAQARGMGGKLYAAVNAAHPRLKRALLSGFVTRRWSVVERFRQAAQHFDAAASLGRPFSIAPNYCARLMQLDELAPGLALTIDQPAWLFRDGLLTLSLWSGTDRIYTLTFTLGFEKSALVAHVGGLQGRSDEQMLDLYRTLTKAAFGVRPRDLLIELFRILCQEAGVKTIYATSARTHYYNSFYYRVLKRIDAFSQDYDACWSDRGATLLPNGLFQLAPGLHLRDPEQVPAKKRSMYRNRRSMMIDLRLRLATALAFPEELAIHRHAAGEQSVAEPALTAPRIAAAMPAFAA